MFVLCHIFHSMSWLGMDPYSRRATWDLLKKKKEGRVIILVGSCGLYHHVMGCDVRSSCLVIIIVLL